MHKLRSLDGVRSPAKRRSPGSQPAADSVEPEPLNGTRWLYDSEAEFRKAQKRLQAEEAHEQLKKQLAQKAKLGKAKNIGSKILRLATLLPIALANYIRQITVHPGKHKIALALTTIIIAGLTTLTIIQNNPKAAQTNTDSQVLSSNLPTAPTFTTLAPGGNIKQATGGELRYDATKKVASYTDTIQNVPITISQQELPGHFLLDPAGGMANLASSINVKDEFKAGDVTVYVGQPNNTHTAVFIKNQVLVFITAQSPVSSQVLTEYINGLH